MISPKHAGLIMIAVAMILIALSAAAVEPVQDMKPGAVCYIASEIKSIERIQYLSGKHEGYQQGGQAAVNELLGHFKAMCSAYQNSPDKAGLSAPTVELRNGIRIQCAK